MEVAGGRPPASLAPLGVVVGERRDLVDQISMRPWLSLERVLLVEEEGEEMVVKEGRYCKQLGECCSWVWQTGWEGQVGQCLPPVSWPGSGSAGEPRCCT